MIKPFPLPESSSLCHTAVRIVRKLQDAGFEAYLVGGCVRDLVSGKRPKDFDITTSAHPEEVMNIFEHSIPVGAAFGVVTVVEDNSNFEVATFREERDYMDGRRPETLRYSKTPEEDVSRRDFTINALLYDVKSKSIIDHTGGLADTVCNYDKGNTASGTGFVFWELNAASLNGTIRWAADIWRRRPDDFRKMQHNAMTADFSWNKTASEYEKMYQDAHR